MTVKEKYGCTAGTAASWVAFALSTLGLPWVTRWVWVVDTTLTGSRRKGLDVGRKSWACLTSASPLSCSCLHVLALVMDAPTSDPVGGADLSQSQPPAVVGGVVFNGPLGSKWPNGLCPACSHGRRLVGRVSGRLGPALGLQEGEGRLRLGAAGA